MKVTQSSMPLLDSEGKKIEAHAGGVIKQGNTFYWYGENKQYTTGRNKIWTWGVKCYSSQDLVTWHDEGYIMPPSQDEGSWLHPSRHLDRPHIVYCPSTKKYVCWIKFSGKTEACFGIYVSENLLGGYSTVRENFRPFGLEVGDFDIYVNSAGEGFLYFVNAHNGIAACRLTPDLCNVAGEYKMYYTGLCVPYCREGVAVAELDGKLYMFTSGMTGYIPNPSEVALLSSPLGEIRVLGNPHVGDSTQTSFSSQISRVFKVGNGAIAIADRWIPCLKFKPGQSEKMMRALASCIDGRRYRSNIFEKMSLARYPWNCNRVNTSLSEYVWLPVELNGGIPSIKWTDKFTLEM